MSRLVVRSMASSLVLPGNPATGSVTPADQTSTTIGLTNSFTTGAWVRLKQKTTPNNVDSHTILKSGFSFAGNQGYMFQIRGSSGTMSLFYGNSEVLSPIGVVPYGNWVHVAWTLSGTTLKGYINGVEVWSTTITRKDNAVGGNVFFQENSGTGSGERRLMGNVAEVFSVRSTLTSADLVNIMNGRFSLVSLDILYKLNDVSGTSAADSSGNSNTGTITNPVWSTTDTPFKLRSAA